jgi:hypothetical protein
LRRCMDGRRALLHRPGPAGFQVPRYEELAESFEQDIAQAGFDDLHLVAEADGVVVGLLVAELRHEASNVRQTVGGGSEFCEP